MQNHGERARLAKEKLMAAERAIDALLHQREFDHEQFDQLLAAARSARRELIAILSKPNSEPSTLSPARDEREGKTNESISS
jgi:hypothetical protein